MTKNKTALRGAFIYRKGRRNYSTFSVSVSYALALFLLEHYELRDPPKLGDDLPENHPLRGLGEYLSRKNRQYVLTCVDVLAKTRGILASKKHEGARKALINEHRSTLVEIRKLVLRAIKAEEEHLYFGWKTR